MSRSAKLLLTQLQVLAPLRVTHLARVHRRRQLAREMRVHPVVRMHDHVRTVIAEIETRYGTDPRHRLTSQRFVEILQFGADDFSPLLAAIGIAAARTGTDEEKLLPRIFHSGPIRNTRVARKTSRRKKSNAAIRASMAAMNSVPTILLIG